MLKDSPLIRRKYEEIKKELERTKDNSIIRALNQELEVLQQKCKHLYAKKSIMGKIIDHCPDCGYLDPTSNLYIKEHNT
jgi:hypothetical protein